MGKHRILLSVSVLFVLSVIALCPGCLTGAPPEENLTAAGLADQYLLHADGIRDYRSEYSISSGTVENPFPEQIRYDYKSPFFARMEQTRSSSRVPGSFATTNSSGTAWYDAETRTYDLSSGMKLPREYDYQAIVRRIISDRNFVITGRDTSHGAVRYQIEVGTEPWSDKYTPYISSRIRAWVEPSSGLAWNIMAYYGCGPSPVPTTPPGSGTPAVCGVQERPNNEIQYESIAVNTGIPDAYFDFIPPEGSSPRCVPKYVNYVEPPRAETAVPIDQPLPGGVRFSFNESDSGKTIFLESGEIVEITLSTIPGLGFRWIMPAEGSGMTLLNAGPFYEMPATTADNYSEFIGRGYYRWRYRAEGPGIETIDGIFSLSGCDIQGAKQFNLTMNVAGADGIWREQGTIVQKPPGPVQLRVPDHYTTLESVRNQSTEGIRFGERSAAVAVGGYLKIPEDQQTVYPANYTGQCILNESMIAVSNGLAGRELSAGSYLETVCPEYFAGLTGSYKAALYNETLTPSKIPDRDEMTAFVPPLNVAGTRIRFDPAEGVPVLIAGILVIAALAIGYFEARRYGK